EDVQTITTWLESRGFQSIKPATGRNVIEFSGNAGQVQAAFHTAIHSYVVNGKQHFANATDPSIPTALTPAVAGVLSLNDFGRRPMNQFAGTFRKPRNTSKAEPIKSQYTFTPTQGITYYAVGPQDFATIYNVTSLWNAGITGSGETIAIISDSNISLTDVSQFRSLFDLPSNTPNVIFNGTNPGLTADEVEAIIDVEWAGAVAKNATIDLVVSPSTHTTFGGDLSAEYIIDRNLAPILSESYGACELALGTGTATTVGTNAFYNSLWAQGASQGITIIIATGDNGSATCDNPYDPTLPVTTDQAAQYGLSVSGLSSTPYNVAVGGTDFNQITTDPSLYWNSSTNNTPGTESSAKGYIPETTWNDTCTNAVLGLVGFSTNAEANCNDTTGESDDDYAIGPVGGGGGPSNCTTSSGGQLNTCSGGYPKPSWQTGTGVPSDGKRDTPDISLFAGNGFAGSFYVVCEADQQNGVPCNLTANGYSDFLGYGGTSVSAQVFAGIVALIDQKAGGAQGNLNPAMYALAATQSPSSCNTDNPASSCIFYDVTIGNNSSPCLKGSLNCTVNNSNDLNGVLSGYSAGTGYDLTTGLGSVNAFNLATSIANSFSSYALSSASPTVTVAAPGDSGTMSATITAKNGFSGTVTFSCSSLPSGATCSFNPPSAILSSTATTAVTTLTVSTTAPSAVAPTRREP
ncbi:MAG: S53 family peptidase, partial [Candidatus Acidiferrales bacterium]